jgi:hypothetical protein
MVVQLDSSPNTSPNARADDRFLYAPGVFALNKEDAMSVPNFLGRLNPVITGRACGVCY